MSALQWDWQGPVANSGGALLLLILILSMAAAYRRLWRQSPSRFLMVLFSSLMASLALAALLNPPNWRSAGSGVVLITEGAYPDEAEGEVYVTADVDSPSSDASLLLHAGQLPLRKADINRLEIRGNGLRPAELRAFPRQLDVAFAPPQLEGIVDIRFPRKVTVGALARIGGHYISPQDGVASLTLTDPAGVSLASHPVMPGDRFEFDFRPLATGPVSYRLTLERGQESLASEAVMLEVTEGENLDLMVHQSAPSFDARQLRRWAGDQGSRLWVRTQISQDRWITQGTNVPEGELETGPTPLFLSGLDLLIFDGRSWAELRADQRDHVAAAVEEGLGLMLWVDAELAESMLAGPGDLTAGFELTPDPGESLQVLPTIEGLRSETALSLAPFDIASEAGHVLLGDASGRPLEVWMNHGAGRVGMSLLRERHRWVTSGEHAHFSAYWNQVIGTLARPRAVPYLLHQASGSIAQAGERAELCAMNDDGPLKFLVIEPSGAQRTVAASADPLGSPTVCAWFWPGAAGWHRVELQDQDTSEDLDHAYLYVYGASDWHTAILQQRQQASLDWFSGAEDKDDTADNLTEDMTIYQPLNPVWPWLLFVVFCTVLWIERRLDS